MSKYDFVKKLAKKEILVPHINRYLAKGVFPDKINFDISMNKEKDDAFHPSSDCVPCEGALYFKFMAYKLGVAEAEEISSSSQKNFLVGHFWHGLLQHILVEELNFADWQDVERECGIKADNWWARGFVDVALCTIPGRAKPYLIDFKTMNAFHYAKPPSDLLNKWKHQVNMYMDWTGMECAIIVGIQKDTPHDFQEFVFEKDDDLIGSVYAKWEAVADALDAGVPPECNTCEGECVATEYIASLGG